MNNIIGLPVTSTTPVLLTTVALVTSITPMVSVTDAVFTSITSVVSIISSKFTTTQFPQEIRYFYYNTTASIMHCSLVVHGCQQTWYTIIICRYQWLYYMYSTSGFMTSY